MRIPFLVLTIVVGSSVAALSGDAEIGAARNTIESQLKAFQADDGALAYSYAAPTIKRIFPSAEIFMDMVEKGYRPVRSPRNYAFGKVEELGGGRIAQEVMLTGPDGREYEALYTLELQPDGVWRITSVTLKVSEALST
jgi:hypothetical protein